MITSASSCVNSDFRLDFATLDIQNSADKQIFRIFSDSFVIGVRITDKRSMMNQIDYLLDKSFAQHSSAEKTKIVRIGADHPLDFTFTQKCKRCYPLI